MVRKLPSSLVYEMLQLRNFFYKLWTENGFHLKLDGNVLVLKDFLHRIGCFTDLFGHWWLIGKTMISCFEARRF